MVHGVNFAGRTGTNGYDLDFVSDGYHFEDIVIIDEVIGHKNVLRIKDSDGWATVFSEFGSTHISGTVEFWILVGDATQKQSIALRNETTGILGLKIENEVFSYTDVNGTLQSFGTCLDNTWYHFRWSWRADDTYDFYLDQSSSKKENI